MWFILIIIGLFSPFINCNDKPLLQELLVPKNLEENHTIRLSCGLIKGESVEFEWYKNNEKLEDRTKRKIKHRDDSSDLIIESLSIEDLGDYKCISRNKFGEDMQRISLYFNVKPKWTIEPNDVMSSLSKEVILECKSIGYPLPINKWIKLSDDKKTIVKEFQPSDTIKFELTKETSGYYKCISSNLIGSIEKIVNVGYYEINCFDEDKPVISELFTSSKLNEGKKCFLACHVNSGKGSNLFEWYFNGQKIESNDNITIIQHDDFSKLNIKSMNLEYSGDYTCKVTNSFGFDSRTISIKLNVKPRWIIQPTDIQTKLHSKFSTKCEANGIPRPVIRWIKLSSNGDKVTIDSDELKFNNFTKSDGSNYKCLAENELGMIEKTIKITYYDCTDEKPKLQEFIMPKIIAENQTIRIMCSIIQGESVQFEWYKDDKKLDETNKRKIKYNDDSSELVIKSLSIDDLGEYKCISKNEYGEDSQRIPLYFEVKPKKWVKEPMDMMSKLSKEVILECDAKGYPATINQWIKLSNDKKTTVKEFKPSNTIVFKLKKETSGYYKCISSNSMGSIEKIINVKYYGKLK